MKRRFLGGGLLLAAAARLVPRAQAAEGTAHRIVLHFGSNDPAAMRTALNNIENAHTAYAAIGQTVTMELVANGGGYAMLRADISPVKDRVSEIHALFPAVVFSACQMTRKLVAAAEHKLPSEIPEVPEATDVPAGIVRVTELQEQGWSYVRV